MRAHSDNKFAEEHTDVFFYEINITQSRSHTDGSEQFVGSAGWGTRDMRRERLDGGGEPFRFKASKGDL